MRKIGFITLALTLLVMLFTTGSCGNNSSTSTNSNITLNVNGNSGCSIISKLDGSNPITTTGNGSFVVYFPVSNGSHSVAVSATGGTGSCTFNVQNANHDISVYNPCSSGFVVSCN